VTGMSNDEFKELNGLIREKLSLLGVSILSTIIGSERTSTLSQLGVPIESTNLADALLLQKGTDIFKDKMVRYALLNSVGAKKLEVAFDRSIDSSTDVEQLANFLWGDNDKSHLFLSILGINSELYFESTKSNDLQTTSEVITSSPLHGYQEWVRRKIISELILSENDRSIVHMPTGAGKTRVAMEALSDFFRSFSRREGVAVWMAHSEELCEQACESFYQVWQRMGPSNAHILRLWGGRTGEIVEDKHNLVVTSFQTAYSMLGTTNDLRFALFAKIKQRTNLLIVDEAHQSIAPTYKQAIELFSNDRTKILGLTATPGRHGVNADSDQSIELANFYRNNKITIVGDRGEILENPIEYLRERKVLSSYDVYSITGSSDVALTDAERIEMSRLLDVPQSVLKKLASDHVRTAQVAAAVLEVSINRGLQTIVFCPTKDNAIDLALYLRLNKCSAAAITGETPSSDRATLIDEYKNGFVKVITNFGVLTAGFDAPNTEAVIIARPTFSVVLFSQMVGRGLRGPMMGGTDTCLIVNVEDNIQNMPNIDEAFGFFNEFYGEK
jgi:DNA repair protein RadD